MHTQSGHLSEVESHERSSEPCAFTLPCLSAMHLPLRHALALPPCHVILLGEFPVCSLENLCVFVWSYLCSLESPFEGTCQCC